MRLQVLLGRFINRNDGFPGSSLGFWETAHLPLPSADINTDFLLRAECWLRGGVGGQLTKRPKLIRFAYL